MYTDRNFKTKQAFKEAVAEFLQFEQCNGREAAMPYAVTYHQPGPFGGNEKQDGVLYFEGPHYPQPHKWYAQAEAKDGVVVKVR